MIKRHEHTDRVVPFTARDGMQCNLVNVRGPRDPDKGPVILVHGAGVRGNIFRAPTESNFVDVLVDRGYDVWLENWRASIDLPRNEWTLDQAALHDHPAAVDKVIEETGAAGLKAVIHCQGSTSFMMSAVAGLLPKVSTIISNAVSLHPVVPRWSAFKLNALVPVIRRVTPYLNPQWDARTKSVAGRMFYYLTELTHRECRNSVCRQVSFYYGSGFPALWSHENLNDETHEWLKTEFANVPVSFFRQIARCVRRGVLTPFDHPDELPDDFAGQPPRTDARFILFGGEDNRCFLPESQRRTFDWLESMSPGRHSLHILPRYGHLDIFMGRHADRDVFPIMLRELDKSTSPRPLAVN